MAYLMAELKHVFIKPFVRRSLSLVPHVSTLDATINRNPDTGQMSGGREQTSSQTRIWKSYKLFSPPAAWVVVHVILVTASVSFIFTGDLWHQACQFSIDGKTDTWFYDKRSWWDETGQLTVTGKINAEDWSLQTPRSPLIATHSSLILSVSDIKTSDRGLIRETVKSPALPNDLY